jgi:putative PIN family toxin of toxin-antitoxin system
VIDTGIFVSALITKGTPPHIIYTGWRDGLIDVVTSEAQLVELERVLTYPKLQKYISRDEADILIDTLSVSACIVNELHDIHISKDPDDNKIIATAIAGQAELLVSGDKADILSLGGYKNIKFVTARQAIERLNLY